MSILQGSDLSFIYHLISYNLKTLKKPYLLIKQQFSFVLAQWSRERKALLATSVQLLSCQNNKGLFAPFLMKTESQEQPILEPSNLKSSLSSMFYDISGENPSPTAQTAARAAESDSLLPKPEAASSNFVSSSSLPSSLMGASIWQLVAAARIIEQQEWEAASKQQGGITNQKIPAPLFFQSDAMPNKVASSNIGPDASFWSSEPSQHHHHHHHLSSSAPASSHYFGGANVATSPGFHGNSGNGGHHGRISSDRNCNNCRTTKTSKWYKDHLDVGKYICKKCYNHRYKERNRFI